MICAFNNNLERPIKSGISFSLRWNTGLCVLESVTAVRARPMNIFLHEPLICQSMSKRGSVKMIFVYSSSTLEDTQSLTRFNQDSPFRARGCCFLLLSMLELNNFLRHFLAKRYL